MGLKGEWTAFRGTDVETVLDRLRLEVIGETSCEFDAAFACAQAKDGWIIVAGLDPKKAGSVGAAAAIGCRLSDTVMVSEVICHGGDEVAWSVIHDPDHDPDDEMKTGGLQVTGAPPADLAELHQAALARERAEEAEGPDFQSADHVFDVPMELAERICGYLYGQTEGLDWLIVAPVGRRRAVSPRGRLSQAISTQINPHLMDLGWAICERDTTRLDWARREVDGAVQSLRIDYFDAEETSVDVSFATVSGARRTYGSVPPDRPRRPLWSYLPGLHAVWRAKMAVPDPVGTAIAAARAQIDLIERFLTTGERDPSLWVRAWEDTKSAADEADR